LDQRRLLGRDVCSNVRLLGFCGRVVVLMDDLIVKDHVIEGFDVRTIDPLGQMIVQHDNDLDWETLQLIKNTLWGEDAPAIEVYPPSTHVVNNGNFRHLWRLSNGDFYPDMLGRIPTGFASADMSDMLEVRYIRAWAEAWNIEKKAA